MRLRKLPLAALYFPYDDLSHGAGQTFEALTPWYFEAASWLRRWVL